MLSMVYGRVPFVMLNALGHRDNFPLPSKCPIHPRNPPDLRHPRSIISQNEFANSMFITRLIYETPSSLGMDAPFDQ
jgi:hypothetical protein